MTSKARQFVLLSDLHAHAWSAFAKGDGVNNSRLRRSLDILRTSLEKAESLDIPWVFAGDIVHTAGYTLNVVMGELTAVLSDFPDVDKVAVWGNHDARGIGGRITLDQTVFGSLARSIPNLHVLDPSTSDHVEVGSIRFSGAGYQPSRDALVLAEPSDVGIYHQTIRGTVAPNGLVLEEGVEPNELLDLHRIVVVGHVHHPQEHEAGEKRIGQLLLIPGSPEHHNFGDSGAHGWWIIDVPSRAKAQPTGEFILGGSPEFRTVDSPTDVRTDGHFYRVRSVRAGEVVPDGVVVVAPAPEAIAQRNVLQGAHGKETIDLWLKTNPPDTPMDMERFRAAGQQLLGHGETAQLLPWRINAVHIRNFCCYDTVELRLHKGLWLVVGKGRDFPSNGAGKTTLFEAMFWALFGRTTKGLRGDDVVRHGTDECEVRLEIVGAEPTDGMVITRRRGGKAADLEVQTASGPLEAATTAELTTKLGAFLGVTPELYQALGYFSQEKLVLFASATDGERKEMLADLLGLSIYQEASKAAQARCADMEVKAQMHGAMLEREKRMEQDENVRLETLTDQSEKWEHAHAARLAAAEAALADGLKTLPEFMEKRTTALRDSMCLQLDRQHAKAVEKEATARAQQEQLGDCVDPSTLPAEDDVAGQLREALGSCSVLTQLAEKQNKEIQRVENEYVKQERLLAAGHCPSCGQDVTEEHRQRCLAPLADRLDALRREVTDLVRQHAEAVQRAADIKATLSRVQHVRARWALRQAALRDETLARCEQEAVAQQRAAIESAIADQVKIAAQQYITPLQHAVSAVKLEKDPYAGEIQGTRERIDKTHILIFKLRTERLGFLEEVAIADYWRRGFSKQGLQSLLVDEIAAQFNAVRGAVFPTLTQGVYDVQFSTVSQTKSGEAREKTEFVVYEHGAVVSYAALSGGQRRRIDVGVMLTLVLAVSRWMQVPGMLGMLVLDEVLGFLDTSGAEGLLEVLREVQEQIPTIFVVSHEAHVQGLFPAVLSVEQDAAGVSRLVTTDGAV